MNNAVSLEPMAQPFLGPTDELRRLGDEVAELSAHHDAATARLPDLIREFERGAAGLPAFARVRPG